jgi:hypothetical protein
MNIRFLLLAGLIAGGLVFHSVGVPLTWTGATDNNFYNSANWSPVAVPAPGDTLNISGNVNISPPFTTTGQINWTGGTLQGLLNVATNGLLALSGSGSKFLNGVITNAGTMTLTNNGLLFANNNVQLFNLAGALVDVQGDYNIAPSGGYSGLAIFNSGTFRKSAGVGTCAVSSGIPFYNTGTATVLNGTLSFNSSFVNSGGGFSVRINSATNWGQMVFANALTLGGPFYVSLLSGYTPTVGTTFQVISFPSVSGGFTAYYGLDLGGGLKLVPNLGRTSFSLGVSTYSPDATPTISVYRLPDSLLIWWPGAYTNYQILTTTNLAAPVWTPLSLTGPNQLLITPDKPQQYFRLMQ